MTATARPSLVLGSDGLSQNLQAGDVQLPARLTVAQLNALTNIAIGSFAFATNGRAVTGVGTLGGGFTTQFAGAGSGCLATCATSTATASTWVVAGTTTALAA